MNPMTWFTFNTMESPWVLLLLGAVVVLLVAELTARPPAVISMSTGGVLAAMKHSRRGLMRLMPPLLRAAALSLFIVALAGPLSGLAVKKDRANVKDIALVVDVSGSMRQEDYVVNGAYRDRLFVTKAAVRDFIDSRRETSEDRFGLDRVGLVLFAGFAWTQCSLTLDYDVLEHELDGVQVDDQDKRKDGTAIGSGLGLAVQRLKDSPAKSKVIVLLTDGINNRGEIDPLTAAQVAKDYGIRVYTIGAGSTEGGTTRMQGIFAIERQPIDEASLTQIAEMTGGKYYRAADIDTLHGAYEEIDKLETTEIDAGDYYEYQNAAMPYVVVGALLMMASIYTRRRWCETIP